MMNIYGNVDILLFLHAKWQLLGWSLLSMMDELVVSLFLPCSSIIGKTQLSLSKEKVLLIYFFFHLATYFTISCGTKIVYYQFDFFILFEEFLMRNIKKVNAIRKGKCFLSYKNCIVRFLKF